MGRLIDLTGQKFGSRLVLGPACTGRWGRRWRVRCVCGREDDVYGTNLRNGKSLRCRSCRDQPRCKIPLDLTNPDWCWLLGVFHGDGHARIGTKGGGEVFFACKPEPDQDKLVEAMRRLGVCSTASKGGVGVYSVHLARQLFKFKVCGVDQEAWMLPEAPCHVGEWLAGGFDADGHVSLEGTEITFSQKSHGGMTLIGQALAGFGIKFSTYHEDARGTSRARDRLRIRAASRELFRNNVHPRYPRKQSRLTQALSSN